jgi:hypothetical protein
LHHDLEHYTIFFINKHDALHDGMRGDNDMAGALRLDKIYVCKECNASFLFMSDMAEHHDTTKHAGMLEMSFDQRF